MVEKGAKITSALRRAAFPHHHIFCVSKKLFVLAGEASGDLHGAEVVRALRHKQPDLELYGVGGVHLQAEGVRLLYHTSEINFMGFVEVAKHLFFLRRVIKDLKAAALREKPDAALLIDYPGMNLLLAEFFHAHGIPVIYYIAPQVWAWKENRVKKIQKFVSKLCVVFDFEVDFFRKRGVEAAFVGHPILEELRRASVQSQPEFLQAHRLSPHTKLVGLLPGSRKQELERIFPEMLRAASLLKTQFEPDGVGFLLGIAPTIPQAFYEKFLSGSDVPVIQTSAYQTMAASDAVMVTSGTATLETLCFGTPMAVLYRASWLNYQIGKRLVNIKKIALANIVAEGLEGESKIVPELLQHDMTAERIVRELVPMLTHPAVAAEMRKALLAARETLGSLQPSEEVSRLVLELLEK